MFKVKTGGKLYLAGEYAILEPDQTALIKNIPIYMTGEIASADRYQLSSDMFDYSVDMTPDDHYSLIQEAVMVMEEWLRGQDQSIHPFTLSITGKLEKDGLKFGIGSSGSVVVLTIKAMAALYDIDLKPDQLFKLSSYVLLKRGDNGSMGDVACIAYDDLITFTAFDRGQVASWISQLPLRDVLEKDWGYTVEPVHTDLVIDFLVGWTRQPSISKNMINLVKANIDQDFLTQTQNQVQALLFALKTNDKAGIKASLEAVSQLLEDLHPAIYTGSLQELKLASQGLDIVAKSSGSGGGDCGIALSFSPQDSQLLIDRWAQAGIECLIKETLS